jgi:aldose 1-epimerase
MNRYHLSWNDWHGEEILELKDTGAGLTARLAPRLGGNLFSLYSDAHQHEVLLSPERPETLIERPTRFGIPLLMPPSRIYRGTFTFAGHTYQFDLNRGEHHSHGLVLTAPWTVEEMEAGPQGARVVIGIRSWEHFHILRQFPHGFHLRVEYRLVDGMLTCRSTIANVGDRAMPFGMGFHTYFHAPGDPMDWTLHLDASEHWELEHGWPTGRRHPVAGAFDLRQGRPLGTAPLDDLFSGLRRDADGWSRFAMTAQTKNLSVICEADEGFPIWVLFSGTVGDRHFLAPEPYTMSSNGFNLPPEISGMQAIPPRTEKSVGTWRIRLERVGP